MNKNLGRLLGLGLSMGALALAPLGCDDDDAVPVVNTPDAGSPDAAGGGGDAAAPTLFAKYGGAATVTKVVNDAVTGVLGDCSLTPYFAVVGSTGHDSADRLKSCLRLQFTALMGGPAVYPGTNDRGEVCADMTTIHAGLGIPAAAFDKFVMDLAGVLKMDGVSDADIATMAAALAPTKTQIVSATPVEMTSCADAGSSGDAADAGADAGGDALPSLFDKYGGAATVRKVVDDAVTGVLGDCSLSPYFAVVGMPGHDSADKLKSCLRLQFTALMGGNATYPGTNDLGQTCADMSSIHAGLGIPGAVFDKFIVDLAGVLKADGVSDPDIATLAAGLAPTKTQIVSATPVQKSACDGGI